MLAFFCHLPPSRSQADALLRQLAKHWQGPFDTLRAVLAHAAVVQVDETTSNRSREPLRDRGGQRPRAR